MRVRVRSAKTGKPVEIKKVLDGTLAEAKAWLAEQRERVRQGLVNPMVERPRFGGYSVSLYERKVNRGDIRSAKGREKWVSILKCHLLPYFGDFYIDQIRRSDIQAWQDSVARHIAAGTYSPKTANTWLAQLKVILAAASGDCELDRNPVMGIKPFSTLTYHTYTREEPNSLSVEEVRRFLTAMRDNWPQHYAMVALGFATGWRPSSMRPLRRKGPTPDVLWDEGVLLNRQSHTRHAEVMQTTKTGVHQAVAIPKSLVDVLREHVANLPAGPMAESELLFPSETGGFRASSCLDKPFADVSTKLGLNKRITPRAMRRTFQDLARRAEVEGIVTRAISGHATSTMQEHYSTVAPDEQRSAIAKVVELFGPRPTPMGQVVRNSGAKGAATA